MKDKRRSTDNFKHYVNELQKGNSFFSAEIIFSKSVLVFAFIDAVKALLFLMANSLYMMIVYGLTCVLLITVAHGRIKKGHHLSVIMIVLLEISVMSVITTIFVGWDTGFSNLLFACITASFYFPLVVKTEKRNMLSLCFCILILLCYFVCYLLTSILIPITPLSRSWTIFFFIFNTLLSMALMVAFSFLFVWELMSKQRILQQQNDQLDELAHKDPLTHLLNRRSMNELIETHMDNLKKTGKRFTIVLGDIDNFKSVNDTYGHEAGDMVLVAVSEIISRNVGPSDLVSRWGGEEILILLSDPLEAATLTTDRIRKRIDENIVSHEGQDIHVSMTFGAAESIPGFRIEHLIQQADDKLYYGKKHGKNQVVTDLPADFVIKKK
ncbi:diguanylate cyclase (GGDEF) domain-containing protein [Lachnospiraceae bacterium XPB1003]|nr:diguanylate cyclase (GGDEF) domain-containing protein [Lachnospiraceae bacterium XPB1003]